MQKTFDVAHLAAFRFCNPFCSPSRAEGLNHCLDFDDLDSFVKGYCSNPGAAVSDPLHQSSECKLH